MVFLALVFGLRLMASEPDSTPSSIFRSLHPDPKLVRTGDGHGLSVENYQELHGIVNDAKKSELGIERKGCFGECPEYSFVMKGDGSFRYNGAKYVTPLGITTGKVDPSALYFRTVQAVVDLGFFDQHDEYDFDVTDNPTVFSYASIGSRKKAIRNYADSAPLRVWEIQILLDNLMRESLSTFRASQNLDKKAPDSNNGGGWFER